MERGSASTTQTSDANKLSPKLQVGRLLVPFHNVELYVRPAMCRLIHNKRDMLHARFTFFASSAFASTSLV
jgi:hypothetical protein